MFKSFNFLRGDSYQVSALGASGWLPGGSYNAENSSSVMAVCNWAASNFAEPPLIVETLNGEEWKRVPDHPLEYLLSFPIGRSGKVSQAHLLAMTGYSLTLFGEAFWVKGLNGSSVGSLEFVPADKITPKSLEGKPNILSHYELRTANGQMNLSIEQVIHIMDGVDLENPLRGRSRVPSVAREIRADQAISIYHDAVMRQPSPGLVVSGKGERGWVDTFLTTLAESFRDATSGERVGGTVISPEPLDVNVVGFSPEQMALNIIPRHIEARICAVFGLPPIVAGLQAGLERSTFANYKEAREAAVEQFLVPKWRLVESALNSQLVPEFGENIRVRFDLSQVRALTEDTDMLHKRTRENFLANIISRETAKNELGMTPDGKDTEVYAWMLKANAPMPISEADKNRVPD